MQNPLKALGYKALSQSLQADTSTPSTLTRRSFLLLSTALTSCATAEPLMRKTVGLNQVGAAAIKTSSNTGYHTPRVLGSVPRNPDMALSTNFSKKSRISYSQVLVSGNYIAITFDDGPHPQNTPRLLEILRARNIKATFYVIGRNVGLYPQVLRRTVAEGHEIGNHSNTHRLLSKLSDNEIRADLRRCHDAICQATGIQPPTMRPPYGGLNPRQREIVYAEFGYPTILWSVDPLDWKRPGAGVISSRILKGASSGGIILAHDIHAPTIDAMPATLDKLLLRGFKFVTVSQLLAMKNEGAASQAATASVIQ